MEVNIRTYKVENEWQGEHLKGVLKVIGERSWVTIMTHPFEGLLLTEHYYFFDRNSYDFSEDAILGRATNNLIILYEQAITVLDSISSYADFLSEYDTYKHRNDILIRDAQKALEASTEEDEEMTLKAYIKAIEADSGEYYKRLSTECKLFNVSIEVVRPVVESYFSKMRK